MATERMRVEDFARLFSLRAPSLGWLIGAGASAAANIPTGYDMIVDFKTALFCSAIKLPRREIDAGDPLWEERVTKYFDGAHGLPHAGSPDEYSAAFELAYPDPGDRRRYIEAAVRRGSASFGHRVLAAMIASKQVPCMFTTNFDPLIERAATVADELLPASEQAHLTVAALDSADRAERCLRESAWPLLVKTHGDYQSERLKNTTSELQDQDARLRRALVGVAQRFGLVVVGYSGRDASIMETLADAARSDGAFPAGFYWVVRPEAELLPAVQRLLDSLPTCGIDARLVEAETFDELAGELERQVTLPKILADHVKSARPSAVVQPVALPTVEAQRFPVLRLSALRVVNLPTTARRVEFTNPVRAGDVRSALKAAGVRAVTACLGREVAAFGRDDELARALAPLSGTLAGDIELAPEEDSWALGLLYDALVHALSRDRPVFPILRHSGHSLVVATPPHHPSNQLSTQGKDQLEQLTRAYAGDLTGNVPDLKFPFAEAIRLRLEHRADRWWAVLEPYTWVNTPRQDPKPVAWVTDRPIGSDVSRTGDPAADWRRERWAPRYNPTWSRILDAWTGLLVPYGQTMVSAVDLREKPGVNALFTLNAAPGWARPAHTGARPEGKT